jgi:hypothetical protein
MNRITFDFKTNKICLKAKHICNQPESDDYKTIEYKFLGISWLYVYNHDIKEIKYSPEYDPFVKNFIQNAKEISCHEECDDNEFYNDDKEWCTAYKYIYSLNDEILILYKIVAYSCDWVANPDCD